MDVAGIEPATPCILENTMLMARLALSCVLYHGFPWYSGANGPKLELFRCYDLCLETLSRKVSGIERNNQIGIAVFSAKTEGVIVVIRRDFHEGMNLNYFSSFTDAIDNRPN